jgi:hypothetical protein
MRTPHPAPRPTAPRAATPRLGGLRTRAAAQLAHPLVVLALAPLLLGACTDDVAANCPPLAHPEVLTVAAAAGNPCAARTERRQAKGGER